MICIDLKHNDILSHQTTAMHAYPALCRGGGGEGSHRLLVMAWCVIVDQVQSHQELHYTQRCSVECAENVNCHMEGSGVFCGRFSL